MDENRAPSKDLRSFRNSPDACETVRGGKHEEEVPFVSIKNPSPSKRDVSLFDAQHDFRQNARELRREQRRTTSANFQIPSAGQVIQRTPGKNDSRSAIQSTSGFQHASPPNDQYFTPKRHSGGSSSNDASYATPFSSATKKELSPLTTLSKQDLTITATPHRHFDGEASCSSSSKKATVFSNFEARRQQIQLSTERMNRNFERMEQLLSESGGRVERNLSKLIDNQKRDAESQKEDDKKEEEEEEVQVQVQSMPSIIDRSTKKIEEKRRDIGYVEAIVTTMEIQRNFEKKTDWILKKQEMAENAERKNQEQMEKNLKMQITRNEMLKKQESIDELKKKLDQIIKIRNIIRVAQKRKPINDDPMDAERVKFWLVLADLPMKQFLIESGKEHKILSSELRNKIDICRGVVSTKAHRKHSKNLARNSEVLKISPINLENENDRRSSTNQNRLLVDAETQVTARSEIETRRSLKSSSPRSIGIEPLNLDALSTGQGPGVVTIKPNDPLVGLNEMLDSIVLRDDRSLETLNNSSKNLEESVEESVADMTRFDEAWPVTQPTSAEEKNRISLDLATARRMSEGVVHYLELHRKSLEESEQQMKEEAEIEEEKKETHILENPFVDEEADETKKFVYQEDEESFDDESVEIDEKTIIDEIQKRDEENMNESADDSSFLLNDRPAPKIPSIFDEKNNLLPLPTNPPSSLMNLSGVGDAGDDIITLSPPSSGSISPGRLAAIKADTPRYFEKKPKEVEPEEEEVDWETYCCHEIMPSVTDMLIEAAIGKIDELRGKNWLDVAQKLPIKMVLDDIGIQFSDTHDILDSMTMLAWGGIVEVLNEKFLKYNVTMTEERCEEFKKEAKMFAKEMCIIPMGDDDWHNDLRVSQRVKNFITDHIDYRIDVRRQVPEDERERHRMNKMTMEMTANMYTTHKLDEYWRKIEKSINESKEIESEIISTSEN